MFYNILLTFLVLFFTSCSSPVKVISNKFAVCSFLQLESFKDSDLFTSNCYSGIGIQFKASTFKENVPWGYDTQGKIGYTISNAELVLIEELISINKWYHPAYINSSRQYLGFFNEYDNNKYAIIQILNTNIDISEIYQFLLEMPDKWIECEDCKIKQLIFIVNLDTKNVRLYGCDEACEKRLN